MISNCPGSAAIKGTPTLKLKQCPQCGADIEMFSSDVTTPCTCGFTAYNDTQTCIQWCQYARECVGDDIYNQFHAARKQAEEA